MEDIFKQYGLHTVESKKKDRRSIDFEVRDKYDMFCAEVWGDNDSDIEIVCEHPGEFLEFDDDEPVGWCGLCGAGCNCHYELDEGNVEENHWSGRRLVPHEWMSLDKPGGIIGKYIKELRRGGDGAI